MQIEDNLWNAALALAKTVKDHEEDLMNKYSEEWNLDILFRMNNFYYLMEMEGIKSVTSQSS